MGNVTPLLEFKNVDVKVDGKYLFKNLSFVINKGDKVLFQGKSGIGKTTIFKLILGFEIPFKGSIFFENRPLDKKLVWNLRKRVAYVSQDLDIGEGEVLSIFKNIFSYKTNSHRRLDIEELKEVINFFGLKSDILHKRYENLSGGEKQRICIIIALMLKRDIFLLDEVTSSLDIKLKRKVTNFFLSNRDWTVLVISHDKGWFKKDIVKKIDLTIYNENP